MEKAQLMVGQRLCLADVIEYQGERLIVALWFANPSLGLRRPEIVIPLASTAHQTDENPRVLIRHYVEGVFPEGLLSGQISNEEAQRFQARKGPDVTFPMETSQ